MDTYTRAASAMAEMQQVSIPVTSFETNGDEYDFVFAPEATDTQIKRAAEIARKYGFDV